MVEGLLADLGFATVPEQPAGPEVDVDAELSRIFGGRIPQPVGAQTQAAETVPLVTAAVVSEAHAQQQ